MFGKKQLHSFADVVRGLQDAVCSAHDALISHRLRSLERFWNGTVPLTKKVTVGGAETEIPLLSVLPQTHMEMEDVKHNDPHAMQVRIRFKCRQPEEGLRRLTDQYDKLI